MIFLDGSEDEKRSTLDANDAFAFGRFDDSGDFLGDGVEGMEFDDFVFTKGGLGTWVMAERFQECLINSIKAFGFARGCKTGCKHEIIGLNAFDGVGFVKRKLVLR
jgi:hypothetical protein